ncbi:phenylacetic acid degradation-like protein [Mycolicibacterium phlei]|uniref:PaaI family thioesterase n=1 Tax=Mycobacteroides chelonae TaxID=1774 RepID=UPI000618CD17|nr:PaaI family thioesterase [Mycobacteroides chelonae]VEG19824.1 phenylacetic acid degradation-like protein [Mycolicibacterium phlei]AKC40286.1 thioesterase [Mycobacteroides chelonae]ANA99905.1 thioesterase [Mycobacteroides chelonae CCUG 47445]OLT82304.1 thioesterase [Mycobacteroides chelonae]ORV15863.1 thioesterase [Mycobacteroides chelonae]
MTIEIENLSGLELLKSMGGTPEATPPISRLLGMQLEEISFGSVAFSVVTRPEFANPLGTLHGGICATLLDSVMGCAVHSTLEAGIGYGTLELKVNYVRTVATDGEKLIATGTVLHPGRRVATAEGKVIDSQGRLVAHGTTTVMVYR